MKLSVYSLREIIFQGQAELLNCKTVMGEITILDNHETFIGVLTGGVMKVVEKNLLLQNATAMQREHFFEIKSGFLEVRQGNEVRCIVE